MRVAPERLLSVALVLMTLGGLLLLGCALLRTGHVQGVMVPMWAVLAGVGVVTPNATALALADYPHSAGTASAFFGSAQFIVGGLLAPLTAAFHVAPAVSMSGAIALACARQPPHLPVGATRLTSAKGSASSGLRRPGSGSPPAAGSRRCHALWRVRRVGRGYGEGVDVLARNNVTLSGRPEGRPDRVLTRVRLRPGHVAPRRSRLRRHAPGRPLRPRRCGRLRPHGVRTVPATAAWRATPRTSTEILDTLDLPPAVFVGHSVSSMIGVLAANARPERFDRLVLVCPSPRYIDDEGYRGGFSHAEIEELLETMDGNYLGWSAHIAPVIMGVPDRPELGEELTSSFCRTDPAIARRFARTTFLSDNRADLDRVRTPSLVLQCRNDVIAPMEVGRYVHEHLAGSELVILDATGHCPNLSAPDAGRVRDEALPRRGLGRRGGERVGRRAVRAADADTGRDGRSTPTPPCWPGWAATGATSSARRLHGPPRRRWADLLGDPPVPAAARRGRFDEVALELTTPTGRLPVVVSAVVHRVAQDGSPDVSCVAIHPRVSGPATSAS